MIKNLPAMQETWIQSLDWEDPLEKTGNLQKHFVSYSDVLNKSLVCQTYLIKYDKLQQNLRVHSIFNTLTMLYFIFFEIKKITRSWK